MSSESFPFVDRGMSPSSPKPSPQEEVDKYLDPGWLRAHKRTVNTINFDPNSVISLSDSIPLGDAEDVASIYLAQDLGDNIEDEEDLHDLFTGLDPNQPGPSRLGKGP